MSSLFLIFYGLFRFIIEYYREPDSHLGTIFYGLSMGQILSIPLIVLDFNVDIVDKRIQRFLVRSLSLSDLFTYVYMIKAWGFIKKIR